jgi:hypothetical protein
VVSVLAGWFAAVSIQQLFYTTREQKDVLVAHCSHGRFMGNIGPEQTSFWRDWQGCAPKNTTRGHQLTAARAQFGSFGGQVERLQQGERQISKRPWPTALVGWRT